MGSATANAKPSMQPGGVVFSMPSFLHGLAGGVTVLGLVAVWMMIRADDTLTRVQEHLPSKTAIIERTEAAPAEQAATHNDEHPVMGGEETAQDAAAAPESANALPRAPIEGLYETLPDGTRLPLANMQTGQRPFDAYKKPATLIPGRPAVAVMFVDGGLSASMTQSIIRTLPESVALSVSPYALDTEGWMNSIRAAGHETWLTLPLQNDTYPDPDPGPKTILSGASLEQNQSRMQMILAGGSGYVGLVSMADHSIEDVEKNMEPVIRQVFGRGLGFIDGRTDRPFFALSIAKDNGYPYAQTNAWITDDMSPTQVSAQLAEIERYAQATGQAMAFVRPSPASIRAVEEWSKTLDDRGLQLVPPSALVHQ
jgi:polysaccharide deacetylase 2 family uncharacterized protein YibQ